MYILRVQQVKSRIAYGIHISLMFVKYGFVREYMRS